MKSTIHYEFDEAWGDGKYERLYIRDDYEEPAWKPLKSENPHEILDYVQRHGHKGKLVKVTVTEEIVDLTEIY